MALVPPLMKIDFLISDNARLMVLYSYFHHPMKLILIGSGMDSEGLTMRPVRQHIWHLTTLHFGYLIGTLVAAQNNLSANYE